MLFDTKAARYYAYDFALKFISYMIISNKRLLVYGSFW